MLALTGTTGKLGGAVLDALVTHNLIPVTNLVICTSSDRSDVRWDALKARGANVRQYNFDDPESMRKAFSGCDKLFLISSTKKELDYGDPKDGEGREKQHIAAVKAAQDAGVRHIYYTSLAFATNSKATVMLAHERTESFLHREHAAAGTKFTNIREGLYNESWPLYLGFYNTKHEERQELVVAGDGPVSWTSLPDLGYANALILVDPSTKYEGKTFSLSAPASTATTLAEVAKLVSKSKGKEVVLKVVSLEEYRRFYEAVGLDAEFTLWWGTTFDALKDGEGAVEDGTLSELLGRKGAKLKRIEETVREMLGQA